MKADIPPGTARRPVPGSKPRVTRRRVLTGAAGLLGLSAGTAVYAAAIEPDSLVVTRYAPALPGWPTGRKLSVTVIADLHAGGPDMQLEHIRRIVDRAGALQSDIVLLLGDFIASYRFVITKVPDPAWAAELARLKAPRGTWAILGNHDWWHDLHGVRDALAGVKIPVLENDAIPLGHGRYRGVDDLPLTLSRIKTDDPVLLMVHEPDIFPRVPERVALTLAGHTHGGQIRVPFLWQHFVPSRYGARFAYGHVVEDERHLIVSGGLGTSIIPARFGVPPEILHIELGA